MATRLPRPPLLSLKSQCLDQTRHRLFPRRSTATMSAFRRTDFDGFAKRMASGEVWKDAWQSANDGFEMFLYETNKTAERIDRRYCVLRRLSGVAQSAVYQARELDRDFEFTQWWRTFSLVLSRNWPLYKYYRKQFNDFLDTPAGRSFATIFFLWFALSEWLFRFLIFATCVLPFAGPLLIGTFANNFLIKGACPACKRQFMGKKNQIVRCTGCGNIVWKPEGDFFSRGHGGNTPSSKSGPDIIDVELEEK